MKERLLNILNDLNTHKFLKVTWLSDKYKVSSVTIRSDLLELEKRGLVSRMHGGVSIKDDESMHHRININYNVKLKIAKAASEIVQSGETIMIESGSTNALLARYLCEKNNITLITNSCFIANFIKDYYKVNIVLLGGDYQRDSEVCVGPLTVKALQSFSVDKFFFGTDGFSENGGFSSVNLQRAEIIMAMAKQSNKHILLSDSSKFKENRPNAVVKGLSLKDTDMIFSDDGINNDTRRILQKYNIDLHCVASDH